MSKPLDTAKAQREQAYDHVSIVKFGGMNSDVSDLARPAHQVKEVHNMRMEKVGELVTRTGIKQFDFTKTLTDGNGAVTTCICRALGTMEYVVWHTNQANGQQVEYRFHAVIYWNSTNHTVSVLLYDKILNDGTHFDFIIAVNIANEPQGCAMQQGAFIIVSLFDHGTYIAWPKSMPMGTTQNDWNTETLGQDVMPTPTSVDFAASTTGDLILYQVHTDNGIHMAYDLPTTIDTSAGHGKPLETPVPVEAPYVRSDNALIPQVFRQFIWANTDVPDEVYPDDVKVGSFAHLMHRGYYYRFIAVRQSLDAEGNHIKSRSHPSTDLFVKDQIYVPPFWADPSGVYPDSSIGTGGPGEQWITDPAVSIWPKSKLAWPSRSAMDGLQAKWRAYFGSDKTATDSGGTGGPLLFAAMWMGWQPLSRRELDNLPPWKMEVPASQLKGASMAIFDWNNFPGLPSDTIEIEVYRTAYQGVDPKTRATDTPLFQPHEYGYVGSILPNEKFTDDVKLPDFGRDPSQYEGYLRGQFSGDVIRDYGQSPAIVLGNIRTDFRLLKPSALVQSFAFEEIRTPTNYTNQSFAVIGGEDGKAHTIFYYAYEHHDGYRSDAVQIPTPTPSADFVGGKPVAVAFTFPNGYEPDITHIILYRSTYNSATATREYFEIAKIAVEPGTYVSYGTETATVITLARLDGDRPQFYEPGAITYSEPKQPWFWKQDSIEIHNDTDPVTMLEVVMGELLVGCYSSNTLTLLRKEKPRSEEETKWIGCVAKSAAAKVVEAAVFFSQDGMYFMVASRPVKLHGNVTNEILKYLKEKIPGQAPLANVRRASCGYLGNRNELWLHIPSSKDLWPNDQKQNALPHRTYVWRFLENSEGQMDVRIAENYTFDLSSYFEIKNFAELPVPGGGPPISVIMVDPSTYRSEKVYFESGSDGTLYASYSDAAGQLHTINCDVVSEDFQPAAYWTIALGMESPEGQKQLRKTVVNMKARGQVNIITGIPKRPGLPSSSWPIEGPWDAVRGHIHERAQLYSIRTIRTDMPREYNHPAVDRALETKGRTIMVRLRSTPDAKHRHRVELTGITIYIDKKHEHP